MCTLLRADLREQEKVRTLPVEAYKLDFLIDLFRSATQIPDILKRDVKWIIDKTALWFLEGHE